MVIRGDLFARQIPVEGCQQKLFTGKLLFRNPLKKRPSPVIAACHLNEILIRLEIKAVRRLAGTAGSSGSVHRRVQARQFAVQSRPTVSTS